MYTTDPRLEPRRSSQAISRPPGISLADRDLRNKAVGRALADWEKLDGIHVLGEVEESAVPSFAAAC